jgi:hypothetical protein
MDNEKDQEKGFTIIVNGRRKTIKNPELSFDDIVKLAFETPPAGENVVMTVVYRDGPKQNPSGTMLPQGKKVHAADGMIFDVTATDKS